MVYFTSTSQLCCRDAALLQLAHKHFKHYRAEYKRYRAALYCTVLYSAAGRDDLQILLTTHVAQACASPALTCLIQILLSHCALP